MTEILIFEITFYRDVFSHFNIVINLSKNTKKQPNHDRHLNEIKYQFPAKTTVKAY